MVTILGRQGWGASQVEKSPCLNWTTEFLTVAYDVACSPDVSFRMAWISFGALPCRKNTWWQLASPYCWSRARRPFSLCNKERLFNSAHEQTPLSNDTIDSVLRHWEVGQVKDLSTPPRIIRLKLHCWYKLSKYGFFIFTYDNDE